MTNKNRTCVVPALGHRGFGLILVLGLMSAASATAGDRLIIEQVPASTSGQPSFSVDRLELPAGARIVSLDRSAATDGVTNLTGSFASAGSPDISFDGARMLFVARKTKGDRLDVWELDLKGGDVRRIDPVIGMVARDGEDDSRKNNFRARSVFYLSTIYTLDAEEPVMQIGLWGRRDGDKVDSIYTSRTDGTRLRRITFHPDGVVDPLPLRDGRVLYGRYISDHDPSTHGFDRRVTDLMTVNTDGTDAFIFAAHHETLAYREPCCELPDGRVLYVESNAKDTDGGGSLIAVSLARSLHTREVVASAIDGAYRAATAGGDGSLLASFRPRGGGSFGIYRVDLSSGRMREVILDDPLFDEVGVRVLGSRPVYAGRSSVVRDGVTTGYLYCMNAYLSDLPIASGAKPPIIDRVRFFTTGVAEMNNGKSTSVEPASLPAAKPVEPAKLVEPASLPATKPVEPASLRGERPVLRHRGRSYFGIEDAQREQMLGEVRVESDGSFYVELPASIPLRLQSLDASGRVLRDMQSWFWVMPKEARGCIGCHEDRELTPPNRHVLALRKAAVRIGLGNVEPFNTSSSSKYEVSSP